MNNKQGLMKSILPWVLVLLLFVGGYSIFYGGSSHEIKYNEFMDIVENKQIKELEIVPSSLVV